MLSGLNCSARINLKAQNSTSAEKTWSSKLLDGPQGGFYKPEETYKALSRIVMNALLCSCALALHKAERTWYKFPVTSWDGVTIAILFSEKAVPTPTPSPQGPPYTCCMQWGRGTAGGTLGVHVCECICLCWCMCMCYALCVRFSVIACRHARMETGMEHSLSPQRLWSDGFFSYREIRKKCVARERLRGS